MAGRARTIRDLLALAVAVILVGAVVVGVVGSDRAADAATTTTHRVTIPAAAFIPADAGMPYENQGDFVRGSGWFTAPVPFYQPGDRVQVRNITLFATDDHPNDACATLYRAIPADGDDEEMAQACSTGVGIGPRSFKVSVSSPRNITQFQAGYIWLSVPEDNSDLQVHGVRITYRVTE